MIETWAALLRLMTFRDTPAGRDQLLDEIRQCNGKTRVLSFLNVQGFVMAGKNAGFRDSMFASDYILRDGVGARLLCDAAGLAPGLNLHGTDLIPDLIARFDHGVAVAIMGTREPALSRVRERLLGEGFARVEVIDGFQPEASYLEHARNWVPGLVILAMGMPKQERVAALLKQELPNAGMLVINGGAIVDYMGGTAQRAPEFMCNAGLEWLYRFLRYPRRMWRRNLMTVGFLFRLAVQKRRLRACLAEANAAPVLTEASRR